VYNHYSSITKTQGKSRRPYSRDNQAEKLQLRRKGVVSVQTGDEKKLGRIRFVEDDWGTEKRWTRKASDPIKGSIGGRCAGGPSKKKEG